MNLDQSVDVARYRSLLWDYLVQRFGSAHLARIVTRQTLERLQGSAVLESVGNPEVYVMGYALSLGLKYRDGAGPRPVSS